MSAQDEAFEGLFQAISDKVKGGNLTPVGLRDLAEAYALLVAPQTKGGHLTVASK